MNLEKRIEALEKEAVYRGGGVNVMTIARPGETSEQAVERELARMGITREQANHPIIVVMPVPSGQGIDEAKPAEQSGKAENVVSIKSAKPACRDKPLPLPNVGIV
jgi:hypothetical protein